MFEVGETIIYPQYGAGEIVEETTVERDGEEEPYFVVEIFLRDLRIMVPQDMDEEGFRPLTDEDEFMDRLEEVKDGILNEDYEDGDVPKVPRSQLESLEDGIREGDLDDAVEALSRLHAKFLDRDMNIGEKRTYDVGKEFVLGELMGVKGLDEEEAEETLGEYLPDEIPKLKEAREKED